MIRTAVWIILRIKYEDDNLDTSHCAVGPHVRLLLDIKRQLIDRYSSLFLISADKAFYTKIRQSPQENFKCIIIEENDFQTFKGFETTNANEFKVIMKPAVSAPNEMLLTIADDSKIIEIFAKSLRVANAYIDTICKTKEVLPALPFHRMQTRDGPEIEKIVDGGDQANRIDVVFMGDGYTAEERDQFFQDIRRLTEDMFNGDTFRSYLPLFNIWAVYVESVESGIGYDGYKDTPFRLYREQGQLRGIYTGNAQYARQVRSNCKIEIKKIMRSRIGLSTNWNWRL